MKKLMIALSAAAAAIFAVGTARGDGQVFNQVDFEGSPYSLGQFDSSTQEGNYYYWYSASNDGNVISNYENSAGLTGEGTVPDAFKTDNANAQYLYLDTSAPLFRTVNANSQNTEFTGESIGDGIYLDTLVKFTAADSAFAENLTEGDKIAIEYVEHEAEVPTDTPYTNFVIRAGYLGAEFGQTNYFVTVPAGFNKDNWYRLTVRTIANIDGTGEGKGHVGFVVYLNGTALAYAEGVAIGDNFQPAPGVIENLHTARTLYPSAVDTTTIGYDKIAAASFSGTGAIDDVVFTSVKPGFINEASMVTITWDTNAVASISIAGTAVTGEDFEAGTKTVELDGATIEVVATAVTGYDLVFTPPENGGWNAASNLFTGLAADDVCAVGGFLPLFDVGGVHYGTIQAAVSAAQAAGTTAESPATLKLLADVDGMIQLSSGYVVIDLAGKTIEDTDCAIYNAGANLLITNSTAAIGHVVGALAVAIEAAPTVIAGGSIDGVVDGAGDVQDVVYLTITGGLFLDGDYDPVDNPAFYLADFVVAGQTPVLTEIGGDNYFQVGEPPEAYTISWTLTGGTTTATSGDEFTAGSQIVFTATSGYTLDFVSIDGTEIADTSVYGASSYTYTVGSADAVLVVTFTQSTPATYEVTISADSTKVEYTAEISGTAVASGDEVADGSTITVVATPKADFEYAETPTGWSVGATEGTITANFTVDGAALEITIPDPTAKQQPPAETWTVTITLGEHVTNVLYCITDDLATTNTLSASGSFTIEKNKSFVFVGVGVDENYELDIVSTTNSIVGATIDQYFVITPTADATGTIYAKSTQQGGYPTYIGDDAGKQAKYDVWKAAYGDDTNSQYEEAFLLNCAPADVATEKAAFKFTSISYDTTESKWVTTTTTKNTSNADYNGTVTVKQYSDVGCTTESSTGTFFKAFLQ